MDRDGSHAWDGRLGLAGLLTMLAVGIVALVAPEIWLEGVVRGLWG